MSGGPATVAFAHESEYNGSLVDSDGDGNTDWFEPSFDYNIETLELTNVLEDLDVPDAAESAESIAQNLEGAFALSGTISADTFSEVEKTIFNDGGVRFARGLAASSSWAIGIDHWAQTAERLVSGVAPTDFTIDWTEGSSPTWSATYVYADEQFNTSISPSNITGATEGSTIPSHGVSLTLDGSAETEVQSFTLSISDIARLERGPPRVAINAVTANPSPTLDATILFRDSSHLETAYGMAGATTTQDSVNAVSGSLALEAASGVVADYSLPRLKPETYGWAELLSKDTSMQESLSMRVNGGIEETA